jgi:lipopolysaccharide transport system permease protein
MDGDWPTLTITSQPGRLSRGSLHEIWEYREVLWAFLLRDVKVKYKQAAIGLGWAVLQPVVSASLFAVFLGRLAQISSEGVPYLLFGLCGTVVWTYFAAASGSAIESLVTNQALLRKIYFPREVAPLAAVGAAFVDLVPALLLLLGAATVVGWGPELTWLALPLALLTLVVAAAAVGLGLSGLNVYYRDVRYALPYVLQVGLFVSPVVYPASLVPTPWRTLYLVANPVAAAIDSVRRVVIHHAWPDWGVSLAALLWASLLLVLAYSAFKRLEHGFADRV